MSPTATVSDLGKKVKAKYPGQYDDLPDDEVGRRVKAKHPGAYDDFADKSVPGMEQLGGTPPGPPKPPLPQEPAGSKALTQASNSPITGPYFKAIKGAANLGASGSTPDQRMGGAADVLLGAGEAAAPFVAPQAAISAPLKTAAGLVAGGVAGKGIEMASQAAGVGPGTSKLIGTVAGGVAGGAAAGATPSSLTKIDPDVGFYQVLPFESRFPVADDFLEAAPVLRGDIQAAAQGSSAKGPIPEAQGPPSPNRTVQDIPTLKRAIAGAKATNRAVFDMHVDPARQSGVQFSGNPIADAIEGAISPEMRIEAATNPQIQAQIDQLRLTAQAYRRGFTVDELRDLGISLNGQLNAFHHKTADLQNAAIASKGGVAGVQAMANAVRGIIRDNFGPDVADIQRRWGYLDDAEAAANAQYKTVLKRETPLSTAADLRLKASSVGKATHGDVEGANYALRGGKTNALLKDVFAQTQPGAPLPTPQGGQGVGAIPQALPPNRQLPAAPPQLRAQSPTGSVGTTGMPPGPQQNVWQNIGAPRQLPPGRAPFTQGTSVPDVLGKPGQGTPYNAGLLGPGSPTQGEGVIQVPTPGSKGFQIPKLPRTAASPPDTSGIKVTTEPKESPRWYANPSVGTVAQQLSDAIRSQVEPRQ